MNKIIVLLLSVFIIICISCSKNNNYIKVNQIYTKYIDLDHANNKINIDDTRIIEKSKDMLSSIYGVDDFSRYIIDSDFSGNNNFYIYFSDEDGSGYFISYNIDKGIVMSLNKIGSDDRFTTGDYKSLDELIEIIKTNLKELEIDDLESYEMSGYNYYSSYLEVNFTNIYIQSKIKVIVKLYSGELLDYNFISL